MLARKKSSRCIYNKFTLNWQILALLLLMRKITQLQKNGKTKFMYFHYCSIHKCKCGAAVESQIGSPEIAGLGPTCVILFTEDMACQTADYACGVFLGGFTSYLRNGWSVNLWAIENCIFSICSIERNMRPILRTVYTYYNYTNYG
jgi:hypothetical protein